DQLAARRDRGRLRPLPPLPAGGGLGRRMRARPAFHWSTHLPRANRSPPTEWRPPVPRAGSAPPMTTPTQRDFTLEPAATERLANLAGPFDQHLRQIELRLGVEIATRGNVFRVTGEANAASRAEHLLQALYAEAAETTFDSHAIHLRLNEANVDQVDDAGYQPQEVSVKVRRGTIRGRGANQARYLHSIATHDINFGIGPAGTGKTFLAVAMAVDALNESRVQRLVLVRPAVEAGEKLGFLPGDLTQKVDPYLRPLYDALYEMLGVEKVVKLLEKNVIEIAPL